MMHGQKTIKLSWRYFTSVTFGILVSLEGHSKKVTKFQYFVWQVYMNMCMHMYVKCVYNPTGMHTFVRTCVYVCVCVCVCVCVWCAYNYIYTHVHTYLWTLISNWQFHWPRGLRRGSAPARLLGLWVRTPPGRGCLFLVSVVFCQVEFCVSGWLLVHRSSA
jgi:hypothetical protein